MKKWTGFIITLVVLILIAYFAIGFLIQSTLNKNINSIPKSTAFSVQLNNYHRGWFSSQATLKFKMHIPAQNTTDKNGVAKTEPPADFDIDIPILIKHGPFIFTEYGLRFGSGLVTTQPETHYQAFISYLNKTIFKYTLPSFEMEGQIGQNEGDFKFNWQGLTSLLCVSSNLNDIKGNFKLLGLNGAANNPSNPQNNIIFNIGAITYDYQFKQHQEWLWLGNTHFDVPSVAIKLAGEKTFELERFNFLAGSNVNADNAMDIDLKMSLQKLLVNNQNYGPGIVHLSFRNLDPATAAKINQQEYSLIQNNSDPNLITMAFVTESPKLLAKGAVFELSEMNLQVPEGKITGNFKLAVPKSAGDDLSQIMQKMYGEGHFSAPIATIKTMVAASLKNNNANTTQTPPTPDTQVTSPVVINPASVLTKTNDDTESQADKMLQDLVNKGFLKIEGSNYVFTFKLENQKIMVNGQPFNPDMLK